MQSEREKKKWVGPSSKKQFSHNLHNCCTHKLGRLYLTVSVWDFNFPELFTNKVDIQYLKDIGILVHFNTPRKKWLKKII